MFERMRAHDGRAFRCRCRADVASCFTSIRLTHRSAHVFREVTPLERTFRCACACVRVLLFMSRVVFHFALRGVHRSPIQVVSGPLPS